MEEARERGRLAYERRAWADAYAALSRASQEGERLDADDLERLAFSAGLTGQEGPQLEALERLHQMCLDTGARRRAARAAFWAAMRSFSLGEPARGSGWVARAARALEDEDQDCVERGYVRLPQVFRLTAAGDHAAARALAEEVAVIAARHADRDLVALARTLEGRALIRQGRLTEGLALLDEAMLGVTSGELRPMVTGVVYCSVIAACQQSYALDRAREWTQALSAWCDSQPQLVSFAGACLVHRSEIMLLGGSWEDAAIEAQRASSRFVGKTDGEAGNASYQEGEVHRLRGALEAADRAYALASERGRDPQPGLALLRLAQDRVDVAVAGSRRVLSTASEPLQRARFLPAHIEIMLAAGDVEEARRGADELAAIAMSSSVEILAAMARHADGVVKLAEGDAGAAIAPLRSAQEVWQRASAPYLVAKLRVQVARAFQSLGDVDGASLELDAAKKSFAALGAAPDLASVEALTATLVARAAAGPKAHGLSDRELEVLRLVATGKTNKAIARELFLSEKTIDRHVSNIFVKLGVPTRAAATAWAFQNRIVG